MLAACPGLRPQFEAHRAWWGNETPGLYTDVAELAHYLTDAYERGETSEFPAVFAFVEHLIAEGDEAVRDVAILGILEDLQTIASHRPFGDRVFLPWLGPLSRQGWAEVERMWQGKRSLMDVLRAEARGEQ